MHLNLCIIHLQVSLSMRATAALVSSRKDVGLSPTSPGMHKYPTGLQGICKGDDEITGQFIALVRLDRNTEGC